jgi:hypothetical protein
MTASTSGAPTQGDLRAEVLRLSAEQADRFARTESPVLWEGAAFYPLKRMGVRPQKLQTEAACVLRFTDDGMATCVVKASGELVWSAHLDPPNQWKFSGVTFAFVRVADHTYTTIKTPFCANLSADMAVPYTGFIKMFGGYKERGALKRLLQAREAHRPPPSGS